MSCGAASTGQSVCLDFLSISPITSASTSVTVVVRYQTQTTQSYDDNQTLTATGAASGNWNFKLTTPDGQTTTVTIGQLSVTLPVTYAGGPTYSWTAKISGQYAGGTPSHTISYTVPARPSSTASAPGLSVGSITQTSAYVTVTPPATNGGSPIDAYYTDVDDDPAFGSATTWEGGSGSVNGLVSGRLYYVRSRAHTAAGWGAFANTTFTTLTGGYTKVSGAWVPATPWVKVSGAWVRAVAVWKKVNGTWVK